MPKRYRSRNCISSQNSIITNIAVNSENDENQTCLFEDKIQSETKTIYSTCTNIFNNIDDTLYETKIIAFFSVNILEIWTSDLNDDETKYFQVMAGIYTMFFQEILKELSTTEISSATNIQFASIHVTNFRKSSRQTRSATATMEIMMDVEVIYDILADSDPNRSSGITENIETDSRSELSVALTDKLDSAISIIDEIDHSFGDTNFASTIEDIQIFYENELLSKDTTTESSTEPYLSISTTAMIDDQTELDKTTKHDVIKTSTYSETVTTNLETSSGTITTIYSGTGHFLTTGESSTTKLEATPSPVSTTELPTSTGSLSTTKFETTNSRLSTTELATSTSSSFTTELEATPGPASTTELSTSTDQISTTELERTAGQSSTSESKRTTGPSSTPELETTASPSSTPELEITALSSSTPEFETTTIPSSTLELETRTIPSSAPAFETSTDQISTIELVTEAGQSSTPALETSTDSLSTTDLKTRAGPSSTLEFETSTGPSSTNGLESTTGFVSTMGFETTTSQKSTIYSEVSTDSVSTTELKASTGPMTTTSLVSLTGEATTINLETTIDPLTTTTLTDTSPTGSFTTATADLTTDLLRPTVPKT